MPAMSTPTYLQCSRTYPLTVEQAFDGVLPMPLEQLFNRRYGPIPPIKAVDGPAGPWGTAGQERTVRLADGGSMREELTQVDRPHAFGYVLSDVTGPLKPLAARVEGVWSFEPVGTGSRITWAWTVHPASALGRFAMPVFARLWRGYARRSLARIEELLVTT
jgi:hypothetical protein